MGFYHSTYLLFGAEVEAENPYRLSAFLQESDEAQSILHRFGATLYLDGGADHQYPFLATAHYDLEIGEYRCIDPMLEAVDRGLIEKCADKLGLTLNQTPTWIAVRDYS